MTCHFNEEFFKKEEKNLDILRHSLGEAQAIEKVKCDRSPRYKARKWN